MICFLGTMYFEDDGGYQNRLFFVPMIRSLT